MFEMSFCRACGRELIGVICSMFAQDGAFIVPVEQESDDCNWTTCAACKKVICKPCGRDQTKYCCNECGVVDLVRTALKLVAKRNT